MWKLIIEDEEGKRTVVPLTRDDYTIGRKEGNNIRLTERNVSRDHAALHRKKNGAAPPPPSPRTPLPQSAPTVHPTFFLEDHQSYNGVYVNGLRVAQTQDLLHGDLIQIGDYRIVLHDDAAVEQAAAQTGTIPDDTKATLPNITTRGSLLLERPNRLVMLAGPTPGLEYPLDRERLTIGRAEDAAISVNHNSVSRLHCEIHSLGEGRYEIVDKGSSNGVRVNGSDLRRGIIEAGDIIELGDVRFKFVGAGQIFLPGATDTHQFESIGERSTNALSNTSRGLGVVPWVLMGMILASAAVGLWAYKRQRGMAAVPTAEATQQLQNNTEELLLGEADRACSEGRCEEAHERVLQGIAEASPLRADKRFKTIELRWAEQMFDHALNESDPTRKRAFYEAVEKQPTVDDPHRKMATERLRELDAQALAAAPNRGVHPKDSGQGASLTSANPTERERTEKSASRASNSESGSTHTAPKSSGAKSGGPAPVASSGGSSVADQARAIMLTDLEGARKLLQPRIDSGKATRDEQVLLKTICKEQRDIKCVDNVKVLLGEK